MGLFMNAISTTRTRTGGQVLVSQLERHGARHAFCVPGESYLAALDALHDSPIEVTICRHEGGAAMMAEAVGKLTGEPGICFVTRGPGATNASAALHVAMHDSTPMILLVGQVARPMRGREAFQELDYEAVFGTMCKWVVEVQDARRLPELISRAFHVATAGRMGPVVVVLPEDVLTDLVQVEDAPCYSRGGGHAPSASALARLSHVLDRAERPVVIVGGSGWDDGSVALLAAFAERQQLPVAVSFRRQMLFPARHQHFIGDLGPGSNPDLVAFIRESDLVILIGGRLSELPSQDYTLLNIPSPAQTFIHVHPDAEELGRVYRPDIPFNMQPGPFLEAAAELNAPPLLQRTDRVQVGRLIYERWSGTVSTQPGDFNLGEAVRALGELLPDDTIICNGAGNYAAWVHRYHRFNRFGTQLAPTSGSMGYGVPAAIAAKRLKEDRHVVVFAGDGCFMMNGQEFATAIQYKLPIVVIVVDNGMYGTIRMHQERAYPGRVVGTGLTNPDFAAFAACFGGYGERVEHTADFIPALERAIASNLPSILHCVVDAEALSPSASLSQIRATGMSRMTDRCGAG